MMILERILKQKRLEVDRLKERHDIDSLRSRAMESPPARDMIGALKRCPHVPIVAEIKRASPSEGSLKEDVNVGLLARSYQEGGASAISVLTDKTFFNGSLQDLEDVRGAVDLPVLRKDFVLDRAQLYESRIACADAVLLIAAALAPTQLKDLYLEALDIGITPLVEIHKEEELPPVLELNPPIIGINNRDLTTLKVSLETAINLRPRIPPGVICLGESGIEGPDDLGRLLDAGLDAFLIGTTLMRSPDPKTLLRTLCDLRMDK